MSPARATGAATAMRSIPTRPRERAFIGWFGIRGIGSLHYAAAVIQAGVLAEAEAIRCTASRPPP